MYHSVEVLKKLYAWELSFKLAPVYIRYFDKAVMFTKSSDMLRAVRYEIFPMS